MHPHIDIRRPQADKGGSEMLENKPLGKLIVAVFVTAAFLSPLALLSQTSYTQPNATNPCIVNTFKLFNPNMTSPTVSVVIGKYLTGTRSCSTVAMNNAFCNPGVVAPTLTLAATVMGTQITMMPSCQWACTGCANVTTSSSDGLPVELMDFGIDDDTVSGEGARAGEEAAEDGS